jgi:hypothetical protein
MIYAGEGSRIYVVWWQVGAPLMQNDAFGDLSCLVTMAWQSQLLDFDGRSRTLCGGYATRPVPIHSLRAHSIDIAFSKYGLGGMKLNS